MKPLLFLLLLLTAFPMDAQDRRRAIIAKVNADKAAGGGDVTSGLVLWWKFDEQTGGTVADSSGSGRTGTLNNGTAWGGSGPHGNFVTFDGNNDNITASSVAFATAADGGVTVSWFAKPAATSAAFRPFWRALESSIATFGCYHWSDNVIRAYLDGGGGDVSSSALSAGTWYHILIRQPATAGTVQLWVDGVQVGASASVRETLATANLYVGGDEFANPAFNGDIANFRIYGRAISDGEIATLAGQ